MNANGLNILKVVSARSVFLSFTPLAIALALYQSLNHTHLYADGTHFFIKILTDHEVFSPLNSRAVAYHMQQILPVIFVRSGVTDPFWLSIMFGLNLYLLPIIGISLSYLVLDKNRKGLILLPILCLLFSIHNNYAFIASESFVTVSLFWPLFFYALNPGTSISSIAVFCVGTIAMAFTYELSAWLIAIIIVGLLQNRSSLKRKILIIAAAILALVVSLYWIFIPANPEVVENYWDQLLQLSSFKHYPLALLFIILIGVWNWQTQNKWRLIILFLQVVLLVIMALPIINPSGLVYPILHWEQRILIIVITVLFSAAHLLSAFRGTDFIVGKACHWSIYLLMLFVLTYQFRMTNLWSGYTTSLTSDVLSGVPIVKFGNTKTAHQPSMHQFAVAWTIPSLGIILHSFSDSEIKSLVSVSSKTWQPWYVQKRNEWPNLDKINLKYRLFGPHYFLDH